MLYFSLGAICNEFKNSKRVRVLVGLPELKLVEFVETNTMERLMTQIQSLSEKRRFERLFYYGLEVQGTFK